MAGPLQGVRVLDLTAMLSGPQATLMLAGLGADVVKIEQPGGDNVRSMGDMRHPDMGPMFLLTNEGKRSVVLQLKTEAGREALLRLAADADVFVCNIRPNAMQRLGLEYEALAKANPDIIYVNIVGYGQGGPYAALPAYDDLIQGVAGLCALGAVADGKPRYVPFAIADRMAGVFAANAITTALFHRERTGQGQYVEVPMFEALASLVLADHLQGQVFQPATGAPIYERYAKTRRPFPTSDGYICCMIHTDRQWQSFFSLAQRPDLAADPRFAELGGRTRYTDELYGEVAKALVTRSTQRWLKMLQDADIPAMPMHDMESLLNDEHLQAVGLLREVEHPTEGTLRSLTAPTRWSHSVPDHPRAAPRLGEHTRELLAEAGYKPMEIDSMIESGAAVQASAGPFGSPS